MSEKEIKEPKRSGTEYRNCMTLKNGKRRVTVWKKEDSYLVEFLYLREKPKTLHPGTVYRHGCLITGILLSQEAAEMLFQCLGNQLGYEKKVRIINEG